MMLTHCNILWALAGLLFTVLCGISIWEICYAASKEVKSDSLEQVAHEVYESVKKSDEQFYVDHCINLLKRYPQLINTPVTKQKFSPFLRACWKGNLTLVNYMLQNGADITQRTLHGESPFFLAVHSLSKTISYWNPALIDLLYRSAKAGHVALVGWLLVHGADPESKTICGYKPVDVAREEGHEHIVRLLTIRVADSPPQGNYKIFLTRTPEISFSRKANIQRRKFSSLY